MRAPPRVAPEYQTQQRRQQRHAEQIGQRVGHQHAGAGRETQRIGVRVAMAVHRRYQAGSR
jgi:hypothetical protein